MSLFLILAGYRSRARRRSRDVAKVRIYMAGRRNFLWKVPIFARDYYLQAEDIYLRLRGEFVADYFAASTASRFHHQKFSGSFAFSRSFRFSAKE